MEKGDIRIDDRDILEEFAKKYTPEEMFVKLFGHKPGEEPKNKKKPVVD